MDGNIFLKQNEDNYLAALYEIIHHIFTHGEAYSRELKNSCPALRDWSIQRISGVLRKLEREGELASTLKGPLNFRYYWIPEDKLPKDDE